jgi:hypothetical protein
LATLKTLLGSYAARLASHFNITLEPPFVAPNDYTEQSGDTEKPIKYATLDAQVPQELPWIEAIWQWPEDSQTIHLLVRTRRVKRDVAMRRSDQPDLYDFLVENGGPYGSDTAPPYVKRPS